LFDDLELNFKIHFKHGIYVYTDTIL